MNHEITDQLRDMMRRHPVEALVAIREAKVAGEWRERAASREWWIRESHNGDRLVQVYQATFGWRWTTWRDYRREHAAASREEAQAAADAYLVADGWALGAST